LIIAAPSHGFANAPVDFVPEQAVSIRAKKDLQHDENATTDATSPVSPADCWKWGWLKINVYSFNV